jgi:hypothetical protein
MGVFVEVEATMNEAKCGAATQRTLEQRLGQGDAKEIYFRLRDHGLKALKRSHKYQITAGLRIMSRNRFISHYCDQHHLQDGAHDDRLAP